MEDLEKLILAIFGGIITLAIISVFVSRNSQSPQVIGAASNALAKVVGAAVNPLPQSGGGGSVGGSTAPWLGLGASGLLGGN